MGLFGKKKEELPVEEEEWHVSDEQIDFSAFEYTVPENEAFFEKLSNGLEKTRASFIKNIDYAFNGYKQIDDDFYEELEEILITGDIGVRTTDSILTRLQEQIKEQKVMSPAECKGLLIDSIRKEMALPPNAYDFEDQTSVLFIVGVNGVGKTTTIGKLASKFRANGKKVVIAAADTFRAAAGEQLQEWANRAGADMIGGQEGSDPAAVVYDAIAAAKARHADILLIDTAGRLHNKKNLMDELNKMNRVIDREYSQAYRETLIVLDATTGQNALVQAREFSEAAGASGVILTKMDGTAKGGIAIAIQSELKLPVKYIGVGEKVDDLEKFSADDYVRALFGGSQESAE